MGKSSVVAKKVTGCARVENGVLREICVRAEANLGYGDDVAAAADHMSYASGLWGDGKFTRFIDDRVGDGTQGVGVDGRHKD